MEITLGLLNTGLGLVFLTPTTWVKVWVWAGPLTWRLRVRRSEPHLPRVYAYGEVSRWWRRRADGVESSGIRWFPGPLLLIDVQRPW